MMRGWRCLALACAVSLVTTPALAGKATTGNAASSPGKAAKARDKAQLAFQRDLISVLAPSAAAQPLLGAALLARPLPNQPEIGSFHTLIGRAAMADDADAAVSWVRLADCDAKADACPNPAALELLQTQAADNAAVWLLKLAEDTRNMKSDAAREDLAKAAAAKLYDDYTGASLKALAGAVGMLPPPAGTFDPARAAGAVGMQTMLVYGIGSSQPQPGLQLTAKLCENAGDDASIKADCLKLGKTLEWGSSPLSRSLGLHLREVLADDPAQREDAKRTRLSLIWQVQNFAQLLARAPDDKALAQHLLALARNGGTEMSLVLAALRDNNLPTDPPADWKPH
ncbi:hypothetical protein B0E46_14335 [Rhodanobacter sp. B04]|uniref:hypothetical protein n=1 Tax=Rhodanobacter sp. B04 TaxID=1945860 RepID=UPI0009862FB8|nr:hypothetical protein [Rhodanobacter sp. B04]OOG61865.1 hypothetical protein B0E46_14335 [Rhodanobacter sp. B04]